MSDHTPGPWAEGERNESRIDVFSLTSKIIVARSIRTLGGEKEEEEANARLIAAAPELLEALQFYVRICGNTAYTVDRQSAMEAYEKAAKVIAKATGEAP